MGYYTDWFKTLVTGRPHAVIHTQLEDGQMVPQLIRRWLVPRNRFLNVYLHKVIGDDVDRALHDHPWWSVSVVLKGKLGEIDFDPDWDDPYDGTPLETSSFDRPVRERIFGFGRLRVRPPSYLHRLTLPNKDEPAWTLFITGPKIRKWGFLCPKGWRRWEEFTAKDEPGKMRGCD